MPPPSQRRLRPRFPGRVRRRATKLPQKVPARGATEQDHARDARRTFVLGADAGFFIAMCEWVYEWVTMMAETMPWLVAPGGPRAGIGDQGAADTEVRKMSLFEGTGTSNGPAEARPQASSTQSSGRRPRHRATSLSPQYLSSRRGTFHQILRS